jgi:elongation factor Ts
VAKNETFKAFVKDVAMHIAASAPKYLSRADVPMEETGKEKAVYTEQLKNEGKPADIINKIVEGKLNKFYSEICLMEQPFIKDEDKTIEKLVAEKTAEIGEKLTIRRFARYVVGEGLEKKKNDFLSEVQEQMA